MEVYLKKVADIRQPSLAGTCNNSEYDDMCMEEYCIVLLPMSIKSTYPYYTVNGGGSMKGGGVPR